jgi:FkbM family methyltransferase
VTDDLIWETPEGKGWTFHLLEQTLQRYAGHLLVGGPNTVLHLGAHHGEELEYYQGIFDRMVLVEPDPLNVQAIWQRAAQLGLVATKLVDVSLECHSVLELVQVAAVAADDGTDWTGRWVTFHRLDFSPMSGLAERRDRTTEASFSVQARPVQSMLRRYRPDLLVIDTQGTELEIAVAAAQFCAEPDVVTGWAGPAMMIIEAYTPGFSPSGKARPKVPCAAKLDELDAAMGELGWVRRVRWVYDASLYTDAVYTRAD